MNSDFWKWFQFALLFVFGVCCTDGIPVNCWSGQLKLIDWKPDNWLGAIQSFLPIPCILLECRIGRCVCFREATCDEEQEGACLQYQLESLSLNVFFLIASCTAIDLFFYLMSITAYNRRGAEGKYTVNKKHSPTNSQEWWSWIDRLISLDLSGAQCWPLTFCSSCNWLTLNLAYEYQWTRIQSYIWLQSETHLNWIRPFFIKPGWSHLEVCAIHTLHKRYIKFIASSLFGIAPCWKPVLICQRTRMLFLALHAYSILLVYYKANLILQCFLSSPFCSFSKMWVGLFSCWNFARNRINKVETSKKFCSKLQIVWKVPSCWIKSNTRTDRVI